MHRTCGAALAAKPLHFTSQRLTCNQRLRTPNYQLLSKQGMKVNRRSAQALSGISPRSASNRKTILGIYISRRSFSFTSARANQMDQSDLFLHTCGVNAEPLHRYRMGGYHPVRLGDLLKDGRYKILHKLGWGGYSTVWAARDQKEQQYVAVKISVSELEVQNREFKVLNAIATIRSEHPGSQHLISMLDHFQLDGPNGTHECLVLELLGSNVPVLLEERVRGERLPGKLAKRVAKHALLGLDYLHQQGIAHGDLHTGNLVFNTPSMHSLHEEEFLRKLGDTEIGMVSRNDGKPLESGIPEYLVWPTSYPLDLSFSSHQIKIVDFGESFLSDEIPDTLHTPLAVRAPEVIFGDKLDHRVDLWSMGCMLFELIVGQPPFDTLLTTPTPLVRQMLEKCSGPLPQRWQQTWRDMDSKEPGENSGYSLQAWLEEMYFDGERNADLTQKDILKVGELVLKMLKFEPSARASAREILEDSWFQRE